MIDFPLLFSNNFSVFSRIHSALDRISIDRCASFRKSLSAIFLGGVVLVPFLGMAQEPGAASTAKAAEVQSAAAVRSTKAQKEVGKRFSQGWGEKLRAGGTTAYVQLGVSVFGAMFIFERLFNLRRRKIVPRGLSAKARELWASGEFSTLESLDTTNASTLGRAIAWVARHRHASYSDVSAGVGDIISQELEEHHQKAYPMGVIATLEPLLGLLGMILGMVETFEVVALAGALGNPAQLAGGISEALVTTGLGLAVAIPFLALFHFFKSQTNKFGSQLQKEMNEMLSEWFLSRREEFDHAN